MIDEALLKSNFAGKDGFTWWIGQVADPEVWPNQKVNSINKDLKAESWGYRCKVRIIGFHTFDRSQLPDNDLLGHMFCLVLLMDLSVKVVLVKLLVLLEERLLLDSSLMERKASTTCGIWLYQ